MGVGGGGVEWNKERNLSSNSLIIKSLAEYVWNEIISIFEVCIPVSTQTFFMSL